MSELFLEQKIRIKFCVKLGKNASNTLSVAPEAYGGQAVKNPKFLSGINCSQWVAKTWKMMKTRPINFFDVKDIVHYKFILQGQTVNQSYYMEILKRLSEAVARKRPEL
jgi:hypothetical protein